MGRVLRPWHVLSILLGVGSLFIISLGWQFQASHAQVADSPTPDPSLIFYPTVESTGLPPIHVKTVTVTTTMVPSLTPSRTDAPAATTALPTTVAPSATASATLTSTATAQPSATATANPSDTATATVTASVTATMSPTASLTITETITATESATLTETATEIDTATATATLTPTASDTATETPTPTASFTPSDTSTATITPSPTSTTTRVPSVIETSRSDDNSANSDGDGGMPLWILGIGLIVTLVIGGYIMAYSLSSAGVDRYAEGFILADCPICQEGQLELEERPYHVLGIPRVRRAVRCDNCRSVLREVSKRQWRYAIDPSANVALYSEFNNQTIDEEELLDLAEVVFKMPDYLDEDEE